MVEIIKSAQICDEVFFLKSSFTPDDTVTADQNTPIEVDKKPDSNQEELEHIKNAHKLGYEEGLKQGIADGQAQFAEKTKQLHILLESIQKAIQTNRLQLSSEVADMVFQIAQQLFIDQEKNKESIALRVRDLITKLNEKQIIEVLLHPHDIPFVQHELQHIRVIADPSLRLGGCIVKSEHGLFDVSIERQIDNLKQALLQIKQGESSGSLD